MYSERLSPGRLNVLRGGFWVKFVERLWGFGNSDWGILQWGRELPVKALGSAIPGSGLPLCGHWRSCSLVGKAKWFSVALAFIVREQDAAGFTITNTCSTPIISKCASAAFWNQKGKVSGVRDGNCRSPISLSCILVFPAHTGGSWDVLATELLFCWCQ